MAAAAHVFPSFDLAALKKSAAYVNLNGSSALKIGLVHSTSPAYTFNSTAQGHVFVTDFLGGSGAGALTEESGTGYSRTTLTGVTVTDSGAVTTFNCTTPITWTTSTISATYAWIYDSTGGSDAADQLVMYFDFGGTFTDTAGTFTFNVNASGLATWTSN